MSMACASVIGMKVTTCTFTLRILKTAGCLTLGKFMGRSLWAGVGGTRQLNQGRAPTHSTTGVSPLPAAPVRRAVGAFLRPLRSGRVRQQAGGVDASPALSGGVRVQFEGDEALKVHAFSFVRSELVPQPVRPLVFSREATLNPLQLELRLLCRLDAPSIVPAPIVRTARTYRQAVRLCRDLSPRKRMTLRALTEEAGLKPQHVSDYFNLDDGPRRRDLPGYAVAAVERVLGNTAVSQWHAMQAQLTVLEELQAARAA